MPHPDPAVAAALAESEARFVAALKQIFDGGDSHDPEEVKVLVHRIPLICQDVKTIHADLAAVKTDVGKINANMERGVWIILSAVILALLKLVLIPGV